MHIHILREKARERKKIFPYVDWHLHEKKLSGTDGGMRVTQNEGLLGNDTPGVGSINSASFGISDHGYSRLQHNV